MRPDQQRPTLAVRSVPLERMEELKRQVAEGLLDADVLEKLTVNSPRPEEREWTLKGLREGLRLGFTGPRTGIHLFTPFHS
mmetsp:Transcript_3015/g.4590  ORF Transcript_3015/g.4590 Transcript_3015/m.4590 type:complete len:81 (-) Transcript_3015:770-1012(-)